MKKQPKADIYFNKDFQLKSLKARAIKGAGATVFAQIVNYGIQVVGTVILARILMPDDFGLIAMVVIFSLLLQNFGINGFTEAVIQQKEINHRQISTFFWINIGISFALTIFLICSSPLIAWFYKEPRLELITVALAFSIIIAGLSTQHLALLKRNIQFYKTSVNEVVATLLSVIVSIVMALGGCGYWSLIARRLTLPLSTTIGAWILCRWCPGLPARGTGVRPMLKFAFNVYGNFCITYFSRNIDKMLIGRYHGTQQLGNYDRAYHLSSMLHNQLTVPLANVAVATLSRLRDNPEKCLYYYLKILSLIAFIGMPLSAIFTLIGNDLILLLLGPQWDNAGQIFSAFGPGIGIMLIYGTHVWLHFSMGRADRLLRWSIIGLIVTVTLFLIGLPFGAVGVAVAYSSSFYVLLGPGIWYAGRPIQLTFSFLISAIWKYWVAACLSGVFWWFILYFYDLTSNIFADFNIFMRLLVASVMCMSTYLLLICSFYKSIKPVSEFFSILSEMVPSLKR
ncbi:MAG TPA: lipopolysaccharide biosynthesis protein [Syntrophales bacterium]|nr:lipopolysaccharide biosynthesis protein [Syntrophales bacterium]